MEAKSTDRKTFQISENGQQVAELIYADLLYQKAKVKFSNSEEIDLAPMGLLDSRIAVTKEGNEIASLEMNWKGQIVLTFQDGQEYQLHMNGIFQNKYTLENKDKEKLVELDGQFHWRNFPYSYNISYNISRNEVSDSDLLLVLTVFATNYFISAMAGANIGAM